MSSKDTHDKAAAAAAEAVRKRLLDPMPVQADELALEALRAAEAVSAEEEKKQDDAKKARTLRQAWAFLIVVLLIVGVTLLLATS